MNRGDDIRWAPGSVVEVEAYIKYMTPTSADPIQYNIQTSDFVEASYEDNGVTHRFNYVAIPGDVFPPTDPTVATLTIKIRRGFVVDMYGFNPDDGNPLSSSPIYQQQKYLTLTGETNILVVDTNSPRIAFSQTTPKQLYGETGKLLEPEGNISFKLVDNNPWEASAANSHDDYDIANIDLNNTTTANISNAGASSENLLPVFSSSNRFLEFSYEVSQAASDMTITLATHTFSPGWGQKVAELVPGQTSDEGLSGIAAPTIVAEVNSNARVFKSIFSFVHAANRLGNSGSPLQIPINYANNTPGYRPYQFYVEAMDSSGNHLPLTRLNLVLHVKDTLPPNPYVMIEEFKNNVVTRAPSLTSITDPADNDDWRNQFANQTAFSQYFDYGNWSADEDGFIAAFGTANLSALPYINGDDEKIVALRTGTIKDTIVTTIAPGDLMLEDNVEVLFTIGAVDNAGVASASLEYSIYNISKEETPRSISMFEAWKSAGITDSIGSYTATSRAVFREGGDIEFPIAVPIMMTADDDARDWDSYPNEDHNDNFQWSDWGTLEEGNPDSNSRDFDTSLPVYGSQLQIRTIDRGIRPH
jgi:hypothetical protein